MHDLKPCRWHKEDETGFSCWWCGNVQNESEVWCYYWYSLSFTKGVICYIGPNKRGCMGAHFGICNVLQQLSQNKLHDFIELDAH